MEKPTIYLMYVLILSIYSYLYSVCHICVSAHICLCFLPYMEAGGPYWVFSSTILQILVFWTDPPIGPGICSFCWTGWPGRPQGVVPTLQWSCRHVSSYLGFKWCRMWGIPTPTGPSLRFSFQKCFIWHIEQYVSLWHVHACTSFHVIPHLEYF